MIAIIRIVGRVGLRRDIVETFNRLKLRKKYTCIVFENPTKEQIGMIKKIRDFCAFGEINEEIYRKLKEKRKTKINNFFRLHPPKGGIKSKLHFPKGILGNNKEKINELIERMI